MRPILNVAVFPALNPIRAMVKEDARQWFFRVSFLVFFPAWRMSTPVVILHVHEGTINGPWCCSEKVEKNYLGWSARLFGLKFHTELSCSGQFYFILRYGGVLAWFSQNSSAIPIVCGNGGPKQRVFTGIVQATLSRAQWGNECSAVKAVATKRSPRKVRHFVSSLL